MTPEPLPSAEPSSPIDPASIPDPAIVAAPAIEHLRTLGILDIPGITPGQVERLRDEGALTSQEAADALAKLNVARAKPIPRGKWCGGCGKFIPEGKGMELAEYRDGLPVYLPACNSRCLERAQRLGPFANIKLSPRLRGIIGLVWPDARLGIPHTVIARGLQAQGHKITRHDVDRIAEAMQAELARRKRIAFGLR